VLFSLGYSNFDWIYFPHHFWHISHCNSFRPCWITLWLENMQTQYTAMTVASHAVSSLQMMQKETLTVFLFITCISSAVGVASVQQYTITSSTFSRLISWESSCSPLITFPRQNTHKFWKLFKISWSSCHCCENMISRFQASLLLPPPHLMYIILSTISGFPSVSKIVVSATINGNNYYWKSYT